jgi:hypothetical protein
MSQEQQSVEPQTAPPVPQSHPDWLDLIILVVIVSLLGITVVKAKDRSANHSSATWSP